MDEKDYVKKVGGNWPPLLPQLLCRAGNGQGARSALLAITVRCMCEVVTACNEWLKLGGPCLLQPKHMTNGSVALTKLLNPNRRQGSAQAASNRDDFFCVQAALQLPSPWS